MKAFISWSGSRELEIARALQEWLNRMAPEITTFISPDLPKGKDWFNALAKELRGSTLAFMCLAPPRVAGEWQLVEAGAIWKAARRGGLFPLCFGIPGSEVPEPLRTFQLTQFEREDFRKLLADVSRLGRAKFAWTPKLEEEFALSWTDLKTRVEEALRKPDDGVHTRRGFIHEIKGGWWERVKSGNGVTKLSWMWLESSVDGIGLTISGRGFGMGGADAARWQTDLVSIQAQFREPLLEYYWEGRHLHESDLLYGGKCWLRFSITAKGGIQQGVGEFRDVCLDEAQPPTTKVVDLQRATPEEISIMTGDDEHERQALADRKLNAWP